MAAAGIGTRNAAGVTGAGPPDNVIALSLETLEILRTGGADVNARITDVTSLTARIARTNTMTGRQGQTALFLAADSGRTDVVRYLIEHGARADLMDDAGKTALDLVQGRKEGGGADNVRTKEIITLLQGAAVSARK
jgi:ankyrin repeat protein